MSLRIGAQLLTYCAYGLLFSLIGVPLMLRSATGAEPRGMVYKFGATWCGPCQRVAPIVDRLQREGLPIQSVDIDQQQDIASRFHVDRVPTFVLVVDGKEVDRVVGMMTEGELRAMAARIPAIPVQPVPIQPDPVAAPAGGGQGLGGGSAPPFDSSLGNTAPIRRPTDLPVQQQPVPPPATLGEENRGGLAGLWPFGRTEQAPPIFRGNDSSLGTAAPNVAASGTNLGVSLDPLAASIRIRVKMGDNMMLGSGTVVRSLPGYTMIITCGHIFRDYTNEGKIEVDVFQNGQSKLYLAKLEKFDATADVGIISIPTDEVLAEVPIGPVLVAPKEGDQVACIGCSAGDLPTREQLRVTGIDRYDGPHNIECTGIPVQGRSGGGLFNQQGYLIGVCIAADKKGQRGLYAGLFAVHHLLDECGLTALYQPPVTPQAPAADLLTGAPGPAASPTVPQPFPAMLAGNTAPLTPPAAGRPVDVTTGGAEVVVIIRDRNQPGMQDRVVIIHEASPSFLRYLEGELPPDSSAGTSLGMNPMETSRRLPALEQTSAPAGHRVSPATTGIQSSKGDSLPTVPDHNRHLRSSISEELQRSAELELTSQHAQRFQRTVR